jgi:hypothetical protein
MRALGKIRNKVHKQNMDFRMDTLFVLDDDHNNSTNSTDVDSGVATRLLTAKIVILFCMLVCIYSVYF